MRKIILMALALASTQAGVWDSIVETAKNVGSKAIDFGKSAYDHTAGAMMPALRIDGCGEAEVSVYYDNPNGVREYITENAKMGMFGDGTIQCNPRAEDIAANRARARTAAEEKGYDPAKVKMRIVYQDKAIFEDYI